MNFITKKFDTFEQKRKEREEIINYLTENISRLVQKADDLAAVEKQEQCARRNCLLLHGIHKKKKKNTDELHIKVINKTFNLAINDRHIDRTRCIRNPRNAGEKPGPIIIKLIRYNDRK